MSNQRRYGKENLVKDDAAPMRRLKGMKGELSEIDRKSKGFDWLVPRFYSSLGGHLSWKAKEYVKSRGGIVPRVDPDAECRQ